MQDDKERERADGWALDEYSRKPIDFFPHDANAHDDRACKRLVRKAGFEGYGRYWLLCEKLAQASGHYLPVRTDEDWEILADDLRFDDVGAAMEFVDMLRDLQLVAADMEFVWSRRMNENATYIGSERKAKVDAANARWKNGRAKKK